MHGPPWLYFEPLIRLNFDFDARPDPDPASKLMRIHEDPDPASKVDVDPVPDPQP